MQSIADYSRVMISPNKMKRLDQFIIHLISLFSNFIIHPRDVHVRTPC